MSMGTKLNCGCVMESDGRVTKLCFGCEMYHESLALRVKEEAELASLRAQLATAQAELARVAAERDGAREALALFAKWRTADGVYVQPGDWVYVCEKDFRFKVSDEATIPCAIHEFGIGWRDMLVHECYSTAEAAFPHPTPEGKP